ncbi:hypothetical protein [Moraxella lacunata]|uniref:hypothetical protein n=1 Tax=Moraxella lacunata TaxID=477 RepID=UPI003EE330F0
MKITKNRTFFSRKKRRLIVILSGKFLTIKKQNLAIFHAKTISLFLKYFYIVNSVIKGKHALVSCAIATINPHKNIHVRSECVIMGFYATLQHCEIIVKLQHCEMLSSPYRNTS